MIGHIIVPFATQYSQLSNDVYIITYQQGLEAYTTESERMCVGTLCGTQTYDFQRVSNYIAYKNAGGRLTKETFRTWFFNTNT